MATTILGISPGTRNIGIAVIENNELLEWQVINFKHRCNIKKLHIIVRTIESLCEHFNVTSVGMKQPVLFRSSKDLKNLTYFMERMLKKNKLLYAKYTLTELKVHSCKTGRQTKSELMECIVEKYPILRKLYLKERNSQRPYYQKMFEAIAAANLYEKEKNS